MPAMIWFLVMVEISAADGQQAAALQQQPEIRNQHGFQIGLAPDEEHAPC